MGGIIKNTKSGIMATASAFLSSKRFLPFALLLTLVTHLSMTGAGFFADDLMQIPLFTGNNALTEKGFQLSDNNNSLLVKISNQFNFFDQTDGTYEQAYGYGTIPWWSDTDAHLHLYRPLASISHALDYLLWPDNAFVMLAHNLLIYALTIFLLYRYYQSLSMPTTLVGLVILLSILDISSYFAVGWVAARNSLLSLLFASVSLIQLHRYFSASSLAEKKPRALIFSLLAFVAALLAAEGGLAVFGFVVAYLFVFRQDSYLESIKVFTLFFVTIIIWRVGYNLSGYGSHDVGQYIDPVRNPVEFLYHAIGQAPLLAFELYTGLDSLDAILAKDKLAWIKPVAGISMLLFLFAVFPILKKEKTARFFFIGSLFSLVPSSALALSDGRVLLIPAIGGSVVTAYLLYYWLTSLNNLWNNLFSKVLVSLMGFYILGISLVLTLLISIIGSLNTLNTINSKQQELGYLYRIPNVETITDKHIIVFNAPSPFMMMYLPYHLAHLGYGLPTSVRTLAPAFTDIIISRNSTNTITVEAKEGFPLAAKDKLPNEGSYGWIHDAYRARNMQSFFRDSEYDFKEGDTFNFSESRIEIQKLTEQGLPARIKVDLLKPDEEYLFYIWSWKKMAFEQLIVKAESYSLPLPGPN